MSRKVKVAGIQTQLTSDIQQNVEKIEANIRIAAEEGAQIILPPELFETPYFCREEKDEFFAFARSFDGHPTLTRFQFLAEELKVVIPTSFFEKEGQAYYNSIAIIDATGNCLGVYRKSHIPDGPGYEEKFYFRPGDTGFKVWDTAYAKIGVGICWDQWFPECARAMVLKGAEVLFYPTAIGSEPQDSELDTKPLWQRAMQGHSISNITPVVAANRYGNEEGQLFYGSSFVTDHFGNIIDEAGRSEEQIVAATLDLDQAAQDRASFGFFRDRRPELYQGLISADGTTNFLS